MENQLPDYPKFVQMWLDFVSKMAAAGTAAAGESIPMDAARQMRDVYLKALNQSTEEYMRTPQFLEMMKQSTDSAIEMRQRANEFFTQAHHAIGAVSRSDLDSLLMAIRRSETRILDKLDEITARVEALEARSNGQAKTASGAARKTNGKPARSVKKTSQSR